MINQWLTWLNYLLVVLALLLGLATAAFWLKRPAEIASVLPLSKNSGLPKGAFELAEDAYRDIGGPLFALQLASPTLQVPDLRQQLIYYGKNGRPDAQSQRTLLHFSFNANKTIVSIPPDEPLYLIFDKKSTSPKYIFSPENDKTSLWIKAVPVDNEVQINVVLENEKGEKITEPEAYAQFRLPEKEFVRFAGATWEIGSFRVDGTLLARQRARWFGMDRFLEHHGGEDYQHAKGKQRIDFGENDDVYSVFANLGDCLIWNQNRWKVVLPGEESLEHPLLVVKKIDDRLMTFELWDVEGKGKVLLNLLKSNEPWTAQNAQILQNMFKFVGARTWTQCVFEINRERMVLSPADWLLLTPKGWKKLGSEEDIDNYVRRKMTGTLFVFEGITRKEEKQVMKGTLYSPARNDFQEVEIALQAGGNKKDSKDAKDPKDSKDTGDAKGAKDKKNAVEAAGSSKQVIAAPLTRPENENVRNPRAQPPSVTPLPIKDQSSKR